MDTINVTQKQSSPNEIKCMDCGNVYQIFSQMISSSCSKCGNISYHPSLALTQNFSAEIKKFEFEEELDSSSLVVEEIIENSEIEILRSDNSKVRDLSYQFQTEWQMWAKLSDNFHDLSYHYAYISLVARQFTFDKGLERYLRHRKVFLQSPNFSSHCSIADSMIEKLQSLALVQTERVTLRRKYFLYDFIFSPEMESYTNLFRMTFFIIGGALSTIFWLKL